VAVAAPGTGAFHFCERADAFGHFPTAAAPLHYRDQRLGALFAIRFDRTFDTADLELLGALADQASLAIRNAQLFEQVRALSLTDPLTGLANRRQLARDLAREFAATRRGRQLIAVVFDLDNFKVYNDQYGHPAGDEVLRIFGQVLATETRAMNLAARYGGDEFVALLADTPIEGASVFIERVTTHFQEEMDRLGRGIITISAGYAECDPSMKTPDELIAAAVWALYRVKPGRLGQDSA
jgi:diguanylate cyclase (GGDEF)-like protein